MKLAALIDQRVPAHLEVLDVLRRTVDQINKDAGKVWVGFRPDRADEATLRAIASTVEVGAHRLLHEERSRLQQVLYRFDLQEKHVEQVFQEPVSATRTALLAQFLLERALSKVLIRLSYS